MSTTGLERFGRKAAAACLTLALSVMLIPSAAFAGDEYKQSVDASGEGNSQNVVIEDDLEGTDNGLHVIAKDGQTADVQAGAVTAHNTGVLIEAGEGTTEGHAFVDMRDVKCEGVGVQVHANTNSDATVFISGNIESAERGAGAFAGDNGAIKLVVEGDITATNGEGLYLGGSDKGSIEVYVAGTISGSTYGILLDPESNVAKEVTVFQITGKGADSIIGGASKEQVDAFAKTINYIIKVSEQDANAASAQGAMMAAADDLTATSNGLRATDANGNPLTTAKEGETVFLSVNQGYEIVKVYSSGVAVQTDGNGNYWITVPRGGGVSLTAIVQLIDASKKAADNNAGSNGTDAANGTSTKGTTDKDGKDTNAYTPAKTGDSLPLSAAASLATLAGSAAMLAVSRKKLQAAQPAHAGKHARR